jgi:hypothetical protein
MHLHKNVEQVREFGSLLCSVRFLSCIHRALFLFGHFVYACVSLISFTSRSIAIDSSTHGQKLILSYLQPCSPCFYFCRALPPGTYRYLPLDRFAQRIPLLSACHTFRYSIPPPSASSLSLPLFAFLLLALRSSPAFPLTLFLDLRLISL